MPIFGHLICKGLEEDSRCPVTDSIKESHNVKQSTTMNRLTDGNRSVLEFYTRGIFKLPERREKCVERSGDYVEK